LEEIDAAMRHQWFLFTTDKPIGENITYMRQMKQWVGGYQVQ
jgi:hypothetical protein